VVVVSACPSWSAIFRADCPASSRIVAVVFRNLCEVTQASLDQADPVLPPAQPFDYIGLRQTCSAAVGLQRLPELPTPFAPDRPAEIPECLLHGVRVTKSAIRGREEWRNGGSPPSRLELHGTENPSSQL